MSEEQILLKFVVGQRVVKQGEDSRFEGRRLLRQAQP
jgi:hypothetical protein